MRTTCRAVKMAANMHPNRESMHIDDLTHACALHGREVLTHASWLRP